MLFVPNAIKFLIEKGINYALIYPSENAKHDLVNSPIQRGNPESMIKGSEELFEYFNEESKRDNLASAHYEY